MKVSFDVYLYHRNQSFSSMTYYCSETSEQYIVLKPCLVCAASFMERVNEKIDFTCETIYILQRRLCTFIYTRTGKIFFPVPYQNTGSRAFSKETTSEFSAANCDGTFELAQNCARHTFDLFCPKTLYSIIHRPPQPSPTRI